MRNKLHMSSTAHDKGRAYRIAQLPRLGWKKAGPDAWINPRTKRIRTTQQALDILDVAGTIQNEKFAAYRILNPRKRIGGKKKKLAMAA